MDDDCKTFEYWKQKLRDDLGSARNWFGHPSDDGPRKSLHDANENLQKFLKRSIQFLQWLDASKLPTPIPVIIKSVKETEHGYWLT